MHKSWHLPRASGTGVAGVGYVGPCLWKSHVLVRAAVASLSYVVVDDMNAHLWGFVPGDREHRLIEATRSTICCIGWVFVGFEV
jgi:hypothetical protein